MSIYGRGPCHDVFPFTVNEASGPGLKVEAESVPLIVAFPATFRLPPSDSPNADMLFPAPEEERSAGKITSDCVIVPLICALEICTW